MSTQTAERADEAVDLSDLDLLDDPERHIFCKVCNGPGPGIGFAACGKRAFGQGNPIVFGAWPPDACPTCVEAIRVRCPRCAS